MTLSQDPFNIEHPQRSLLSESLSRITHDINDQNYCIAMGTDLLLRYWEDLSCCLSRMTADPDGEVEEIYLEILTTVPIIIEGIKKASKQIDLVVKDVASKKESHLRNLNAVTQAAS